MRLIMRTIISSVILILTLAPSAAAHAQQPALFIDIQPEEGPPGTTVTIIGRGAPANAPIRVLYAPFDDPAACRLGRGAELVAEINADANGQFIATHLTIRLSDTHAGNTYLAEINQGLPARPTSDRECFTFTAVRPPGSGRFFPETGHTLDGRFLEFWQRQGGLPVFGYPLTSEYIDLETGRTHQYLERARFELFPTNAPPYDVQLGRLGVEALQLRGIDWQTQPTSPGPAPGCLYFPETRHNVCNQQRGVGFLNYWTTHGIEFDGQPGTSYAESLALFGYPITEPYSLTTEEGQTLQVQWFERARFEWHPENPDPYKVLLGRLGAVVLQARAQGQ